MNVDIVLSWGAFCFYTFPHFCTAYTCIRTNYYISSVNNSFRYAASILLFMHVNPPKLAQYPWTVLNYFQSMSVLWNLMKRRAVLACLWITLWFIKKVKEKKACWQIYSEQSIVQKTPFQIDCWRAVIQDTSGGEWWPLPWLLRRPHRHCNGQICRWGFRKLGSAGL